MSPTARTLAELRKRGCIADVVERKLAKTFVTKDLFGVIDVLALEPGVKGVLGVQATTRANQWARAKKILSEPRALAWLGCGNRLVIWGWSQRGGRGRRKLWTLTEMIITEDMFGAKD